MILCEQPRDRLLFPHLHSLQWKWKLPGQNTTKNPAAGRGLSLAQGHFRRADFSSSWSLLPIFAASRGPDRQPDHLFHNWALTLTATLPETEKKTTPINGACAEHLPLQGRIHQNMFQMRAVLYLWLKLLLSQSLRADKTLWTGSSCCKSRLSLFRFVVFLLTELRVELQAAPQPHLVAQYRHNHCCQWCNL